MYSKLLTDSIIKYILRAGDISISLIIALTVYLILFKINWF